MTDHGSTPVITVVAATVGEDQESALVDGFRAMTAGPKPEGLLRSELLRGQDGAWQIQTLWRDFASLRAAREAGEPPAALVLVDGLGLEHSHTFYVVEHAVRVDDRTAPEPRG